MEIAIIKMLSFRFLILLGIIPLVACGGGGSGSGGNTPKTSDTTPNTFTFNASTEAQTSTSVTSPIITISGIDSNQPKNDTQVTVFHLRCGT